MDSIEAARRAQDEHAKARVESRTDARLARIGILEEPGGLARADDPVRVAARIDRLARYHPEIGPVNVSALVAGDESALDEAGIVLEKVINTNDLLPVRYLAGGAAAARSVGRVNIYDERRRLVGHGTGTLVSPALLLTNHHVLEDADVARVSRIEMNFEDGLDGRQLASTELRLDPDRFFVADEGLDFALVAVKATAGELAGFGFNPLLRVQGKAIVGDFVTIVQHPLGGKKQVALRENRVVDLDERFLHYETDTERGSSGSLVFSDDWEAVALHHASVPAPDKAELGGFVNEGIRVSRLADFLDEQQLPGPQRALVDELLGAEDIPVASAPASPQEPVVSANPQRLTIPIEISIGDSIASDARVAEEPQAEAIEIDPDYADRAGFDTDFLGSGQRRVPLPTLSPELDDLVAESEGPSGGHRRRLDYHHFSVVLNRKRRLAFFTAVNIDGQASFALKREADRWSFDPRVPEDVQTGEAVYRNNPLDRGHLVRRLDPAWGATRRDAKIANDDTFHFTNCTPQHKDFNQNRSTWAGLENYVLDNAANHHLKVSVLCGPVLADDDDQFEGVKLPRQFWKALVIAKPDGKLSATGYLLSQEELLRGLEVAPAEFSYGAYKTFQVTLRRIEELTKLSFGPLTSADPFEAHEAAVEFREIRRPEQLVL